MHSQSLDVSPISSVAALSLAPQGADTAIVAWVRTSRPLLLAAVSTALATAATPAVAAPAAVSGEVVVRFAQGAGPGDRATLRDRADVDFERGLGLPGLQLVQAEPGQSAATAIRELKRSNGVAYAEPNFYRRTQAVPDDTFFALQWGLHNQGQLIGNEPYADGGVPGADIDALEAWTLTTGAPTVTVAVIDSGVDSSHPDLAPNIWSNPGETGGGRESNGLDDDGNGYVDDAAGWDWVADDADPADEHFHGTHVAGTIGARGDDGAGVAGVGWETRLMPLRVLDANGEGTVADAILAYRYAAAHGAQVVNLSLGGPGLSIAERDAIAAAPGTMFVAAAGNDGADNDALPTYPCAHTLPNVVCVAASDKDDALPDFSNYGTTSVDLAAPGAQIASTVPGAEFAYADGTSMAAPHVAGAAALVWALHPAATVAEVKAALLGGVDPGPAFALTTLSGGRLNLDGALQAAGAPPNADPPPNPDPPANPDPAPGPAPTADPAPSPPAADPVVAAGPQLEPVTPTHTPRGTAPVRARLVAQRGQRLRHVLRRGLALKARCPARCRLQIRVGVGARTARRLGISRGAATFGRRTVRLEGGTRPLTVRFARSARRRLARTRSVTFVIFVRVTDASGGSSRVRSRVVLRH